MTAPLLPVVTGPTASGKTALAVRLAKALGGEVVSADSMQVYRGMSIGTAKPTADEMEGVPHHMLDVAEPGEAYSVSRYRQQADAVIRDILARDRLPILCGGTGLYIDAVVRGTDFLPAGDAALRARLDEQWEAQGPQAMLSRLEQVDPQAAERLHPGDRKRILRALEVHALTGETITQHARRTREAPPRYTARTLAITYQPRAALYERIHRRVEAMAAQGLVREVQGLYTAGKLTGTAAQAIGYKELVDHLEGRCGLEEALALIARRSCNYAKRQLTWLRGHGPVYWLEAGQGREAWALLDEATNFLRTGDYNDTQTQTIHRG